jgi:YHS domain-containing protein
MLRFILLSVMATIVVRAIWSFLVGIAQGASSTGARRRPPERGVAMVRDPVCGTYVIPTAALSLRKGGGDVFFCSEECRNKFQSR